MNRTGIELNMLLLVSILESLAAAYLRLSIQLVPEVIVVYLVWRRARDAGRED
jgi:hypothetical protein